MSSWKRGRVDVETDLHNIPYPRISVAADADVAWLAFVFGTSGIDPIVVIELNLTDTRAGRLLAAWAWRRRRR